MDYMDILGWMLAGAMLIMTPKLWGYYKHVTGGRRVAYDIPGNHEVNYHFTYLGLAKVRDTSAYGRTKEELCDTLKWVDVQVESSLKRLQARTPDEGGTPSAEVIEVSLNDLVSTLSHFSDLTVVFLKEEINETN